MITNRKAFYGGTGLMLGFLAVLVVMFMPIFDGKNALDYLDSLYNSIAKGSAYYIPKVRETTGQFKGTIIKVTVSMTDEARVRQNAGLFQKSGATAETSGTQLNITGDLGEILENVLADADLLYYNNSQAIEDKYGHSGRQVLFAWWRSLQGVIKDLERQKAFKAAKAVDLVIKKAVETAYNFYGIESQNISDRLGIVLFSLFFYVVYTLWYGFAILYMFEGWGLKLGH
jgi:hypothetical protein